MHDSQDITGNNSEEHSEVKESTTKKKKTEEARHNYKDQNNQRKLQSEKPALPLIVRIEEISRDAFIEKVGKEFFFSNPAVSKSGRIAEISLNPKLLEPGYLSGVYNISLSLFDNCFHDILIDQISLHGDSIALRGKLTDYPAAVFFLSITEKQVQANLRLPERNILYIIRYIQPAGKHYLFRGLINEIEQYECEVRIPPEHNIID